MKNNLDSEFSLSVVIVFKDQYLDLKSSLESVLNQSHQVQQVVLVDCCSTDGGINKIENEYGNKVKVIRHVSTNFSDARNYALRYVSSEYVSFLQAGDLWEPHFVSELNGLYSEYQAPKMMATQYQLFDETENYRDARISIHSQASHTMFKNYLSVSIAGDAPYVLSSLCISTSLLRDNLPFEFKDEFNTLRYFLIKLALVAPVAYSQQILVFKKTLATNVLGDDLDCVNRKGMPKFIEKVLDDLVPSIEKPELKKALKKYVSVYLLRLVEKKINSSNVLQAKTLLSNRDAIYRGITYLRLQFKLFIRSLTPAQQDDLFC